MQPARLTTRPPQVSAEDTPFRGIRRNWKNPVGDAQLAERQLTLGATAEMPVEESARYTAQTNEDP